MGIWDFFKDKEEKKEEEDFEEDEDLDDEEEEEEEVNYDSIFQDLQVGMNYAIYYENDLNEKAFDFFLEKGWELVSHSEREEHYIFKKIKEEE